MINHNIKISDMFFIEPWTHVKNFVHIDSPNVIYGALGDFVDRAFPDNDFIFISTYNGDGGLYHTENPLVYRLGTTDTTRCDLQLPQSLYKLFSTNLNICSNNVVSLPYGVFDNRPYVSNEMADNMFTGYCDKDILCYARFSVWTYAQRYQIRDWCLAQSFILSEFSSSPSEQTPETLDGYFQKLHRAKFMICPPGNGPDTYRFWESLYANTIPIVIDCPLYRNFDLPILRVANFGQVTEDLLLKTYEEFNKKQWNYQQLTLSYYDKIITKISKEL